MWSLFRIFIRLPVTLIADYTVLVRLLPGKMVVGLVVEGTLTVEGFTGEGQTELTVLLVLFQLLSSQKTNKQKRPL